MKIFRPILLILLGLTIGTGAMYLKLRSERSAYEAQIADRDNRFSLLKGKYMEEKARATGLLRVKTTLEGKMRALQGDISRLEEEKDALVAKCEAVKATMKQNTGALQAELDETQRRLAESRKKHDALRQKYEETVTELSARVSELTRASDRLDADLKSTAYQLRRCESHNAKLADIGTELLGRYAEKGVFDTVLEKEPFTGIKKVEVEQLIQEYQEKIDDQKLEE